MQSEIAKQLMPKLAENGLISKLILSLGDIAACWEHIMLILIAIVISLVITWFNLLSSFPLEEYLTPGEKREIRQQKIKDFS